MGDSDLKILKCKAFLSGHIAIWCCAFLGVCVIVSQFFLKTNETFMPESKTVVGKCCLSLCSNVASKDIAVLINGDEYDFFDKKKITVDFSKNTVVEILNKTENTVFVSIMNMSDGFTAVPFTEKYECKSGITYICRCVCDS